MSQVEPEKGGGVKGTTAPPSNGRTSAHVDTPKPPTSPSTTAPTRTPNPTGSPKRSLLRKLLGILVPCIPSDSLNNDDRIDDKPHEVNQKTPSKRVEAEKVPFSNGDTPHADVETNTPALPPPSTDSHTVSPAEEVVVPPSPTTPQLRPPEETAGLTSGAVQPPGSKVDAPPPDKPAPPPANGEGEESEETTYSEEELDEQDEEDRLIMNGGIGIPIGPDGVPKPLLPPISPQHVGRKCLVLDLDETLVHSSFKSISQADYVVPVEIEYHWHNVYVIKRPGVDNFLKKMGEIYEIVVFTASLSKYADPVLDKLDIHQVVSHRLFRESCYNHKGNYVKDLSQLGRPISDTIILDNSPASYIFHPNNAVPVSSWFNDPHDTELTDLIAFLGDLSPVDDVRGILDGAR